MVTSELARRGVALLTVFFAVGLQSVATDQAGASGDMASDPWVRTPTASSSGLQLGVPLGESYGVRLLQSALAVPVHTVPWESTMARPSAVEISRSAADTPPLSLPPAGDSDATPRKPRFGFEDGLERRVPLIRWPENRDSVGAPIVIDEDHRLSFLRLPL